MRARSSRGVRVLVGLATAGVCALGASAMLAQTPQPMVAEDLAKQLANPVANLVSVPLQNNWDFGIGANDVSKYTLNVQPVIPFALGGEWNLITRTIVPVINAPSPGPGTASASGLGDIVQSFFLSPKEEVGGWILGAGPVFMWPTANEDPIGTGKWGAGPTAVALQQRGPWTYGGLANHIWSYAGADDRSSVNSTFLNPFVSYVTATKTTISLSPELTYDWPTGQWVAPINLTVSQLFTIGKQPLQAGVGGRYYFEAPDGGPEWGIRASLVLLFPR